MPRPLLAQLNAITAPTSSAVWAVGDYYKPSGSGTLPLIAHLTSSGFRQQIAPKNVGEFLTAVSATSARNAWSVGLVDSDDGTTHPVELHWSGGARHRVTLHLPKQIERLWSISMVSASNGWMVGSYYRDLFDSTSGHAVLFRWTGSRWSQVTISLAAGVVALSVSAGSGPTRSWPDEQHGWDLPCIVQRQEMGPEAPLPCQANNQSTSSCTGPTDGQPVL